MASLDVARRRLAFALDYPDLAAARAGAERVADRVGVLKVGLELFVREGPAAVALGSDLGLEVFLDLKLCDIPETVERAVTSAATLGARYVTVHASGGTAMLARATAAAALARTPLTIVAVTLMTSLDATDLRAQGIEGTPEQHVVRLAQLASSAGVGGFVASARETAALRTTLGPDALLVIPGIRPAGARAGDQKRIATPGEAIAAGADLLVVGRPIRDAPDPRDAAAAIVDEIGRALG